MTKYRIRYVPELNSRIEWHAEEEKGMWPLKFWVHVEGTWSASEEEVRSRLDKIVNYNKIPRTFPYP